MKIRKMKKIKYLIVSLGLVSMAHIAFGQDAKAKEILDALSKNTSAYTSMQADFDYHMLNESDQIDETQTGSLITMGDNYHLEISGQMIISDGKTVWTVIEDAEEVQVDNVPEEDESEDYISPTNILTLWEKGFNYKYDQATDLNGKKVDVVNLYPQEPKEKSFHTIKLFINQDQTYIEQIIIKGKDGTDFTYKIKSFVSNKSYTDGQFKFLKKDHPSFDYIDLR